MRVHVPLLAVTLTFACIVDKDPLDGVTAGGATTSGGSDGGATGETSDSGATAGSATTNNSTATTGSSATTTSAGTASTDTATSGPGTSATTNPTTVSSTSSASDVTGDPGDPLEAARTVCVDTINMYRATLGLPPYERWVDAEACSDAEAKSDGQTQQPHGAFGMCGESAQNECPGWPGPPEQSLPGCLEQMWAEGPGEDFNLHGHYINMSSEQYTRVSCGFAEGAGGWWMVQNFQ